MPRTIQVPEFYKAYVNRFRNRRACIQYLNEYSLHKSLVRLPLELFNEHYAPGKWTPYQVLRHVVDSERVFQFRALWIARGDAQPQPGFDQDSWARTYATQAKPSHISRLLREYQAVRTSTLALLESFTAECWQRKGMANGVWLTPEILCFSIAGHEQHHLEILMGSSLWSRF